MSKREIEAAIRATIKLMTAELTAGGGDPKLRDLKQRAIQAAERVVGPGAADDAQPRIR